MKLAIARIGRPHGVKGEVTVETLTDSPEDRFALGAILESDSSVHPFLEITRVRIHQGRWMLTFAQVEDRTAAEKLRNSHLYAEIDIEIDIETELAGDEEIAQGESYHIELLRGMKVVSQDGDQIGEVLDVQNLPGQDLLEVDTPRGVRLIPMVHQFIIKVDVKKLCITVDLPEGLVE